MRKKTITIAIVVHFFITWIGLIAQKNVPLHDEWIITQISRLNLPSLFAAIRYEPHPPLFYLLLHLLGLNYLIAKILLIAINSLFLAYVFSRENINSVINRLQLRNGIILFLFSSTGFVSLFALKQDIVSLPILISFALYILSLLTQKTDIKKTSSVFVLISMGLLLMTSYINFFWGICLCLLLLTKYYYSTHVKFSFLLVAILFSLYIFLFGGQQMINNVGRFDWQKMYPVSASTVISGHISGISTPSFILDISVFFSVLLFLLGLGDKIWQKQKIVFSFLISCLCLALIAGYLGSLFVRARYIEFPLFIFSLFMGIGIKRLSNRLKIRAVEWILITLFIVLGFTGFFLQIRDRTELFNSMSNFVISNAKKDTSNHFTFFANNSGIIPFIISDINGTEFPSNVTPSSMYDIEIKNGDSDFIEKLISSVKNINHLDRVEHIPREDGNYLYIQEQGLTGYTPYYDKLVLERLLRLCKVSKVDTFYQFHYFVFSTCKAAAD